MKQLRADLERVTAERDEAETLAQRRWQDRYDALNAQTTEGMSAAEWQMRTGTAERRVAELEAEVENWKQAHDVRCVDSFHLEARVAELEADVENYRAYLQSADELQARQERSESAASGVLDRIENHGMTNLGPYLVSKFNGAESGIARDLAAARERIEKLEQGRPEPIADMMRRHGLEPSGDSQERIDQLTGKRVAEEAADE